MGRTIHWSISNPSVVSNKQREALYTLSDAFNSKGFNWECQNFYIEWYDYIATLRRHPIKMTWEAEQQYIYDMIKGQVKRGRKRGEVIAELELNELVTMRFNNGAGYCKTAGSATDSFMVFCGLVMASKIAPKAKFHIRDEGDMFPTIPMILVNGVPSIWQSQVNDYREHWDKINFTARMKPLNDRWYAIKEKASDNPFDFTILGEGTRTEMQTLDEWIPSNFKAEVKLRHRLIQGLTTRYPLAKGKAFIQDCLERIFLLTSEISTV